MRKLLVSVLLLIFFVGISYLFWSEDIKYSLPTEVPMDYKVVKKGSLINISEKINHDKKPLFIHFFNPACPCSRFNIPHFRSLVKQYKEKLAFAVIVMSIDESLTKQDIEDKLGLNLPVFFDKSIADSCGVYSTPQAVILNVDNTLYYRGNYNKSRYCIDKKTNYAQMAIDSLLNDKSGLITDEAALKSYGCSLPTCTSKNSAGI